MSNHCDIETGVCAPEPIKDYAPLALDFSASTIVYVGDPMCSWCWGIAPELEKVQAFAQAQGIDYSVMVGGLRPTGGDPWNDAFKQFLRHHWQEVQARSGQAFDYEFFARDSFNYISEPSCRAVVVMRHLLAQNGQDAAHLQAYFGAIQRAFFANNTDPTTADNLAQFVGDYGIERKAFLAAFNDERAKAATMAEFALVQRLGVRGFPSVVLVKDKAVRPIVSGYAPANHIIAQIETTILL